MSHSGRDGSDVIGGGCCRCCFSFIVTSGFTALFMWLSLRASMPICSIQGIYIPALNKTANYTSNTSIYLDLKLDNTNKDKGIYYDDLNLTFYYGRNRTSSPIGNVTIQHFYQGHKKKAHRRELVETHGVPWKAVIQAVSNQTVVFRVDLATAVRFKIVKWKTKRHKLVVGADVDVNYSGTKVKHKGIKLKSGSSELRRYGTWFGAEIIIFELFFFMFIG